jgi:hypothetical protein
MKLIEAWGSSTTPLRGNHREEYSQRGTAASVRSSTVVHVPDNSVSIEGKGWCE